MREEYPSVEEALCDGKYGDNDAEGSENDESPSGDKVGALPCGKGDPPEVVEGVG